jgi:hypothetical protein
MNIDILDQDKITFPNIDLIDGSPRTLMLGRRLFFYISGMRRSVYDPITKWGNSLGTFAGTLGIRKLSDSIEKISKSLILDNTGIPKQILKPESFFNPPGINYLIALCGIHEFHQSNLNNRKIIGIVQIEDTFDNDIYRGDIYNTVLYPIMEDGLFQ